MTQESKKKYKWKLENMLTDLKMKVQTQPTTVYGMWLKQCLQGNL